MLGCIKAGTVGDIGGIFGISRNNRKAIIINENGYHAPFSGAKINERYFAQVAAIEMPWRLAGEEEPKGEVEVMRLPNRFEVFANPKKLKKR